MHPSCGVLFSRKNDALLPQRANERLFFFLLVCGTWGGFPRWRTDRSTGLHNARRMDVWSEEIPSALLICCVLSPRRCRPFSEKHVHLTPPRRLRGANHARGSHPPPRHVNRFVTPPTGACPLLWTCICRSNGRLIVHGTRIDYTQSAQSFLCPRRLAYFHRAVGVGGAIKSFHFFFFFFRFQRKERLLKTKFSGDFLVFQEPD